MEPVCTASADISAKIVVPKSRIRATRGSFTRLSVVRGDREIASGPGLSIMGGRTHPTGEDTVSRPRKATNPEISLHTDMLN
ncbi:hypothetical protein GCM10017673_06920 [Streptosporangium violaceochromogenes]|nr:hypothetical protein GCM10017673_06920 [Streptosporangium violaceochromogenes]